MDDARRTPGDLTDAQWAVVGPFLQAWKAKHPSVSGHQARYDLREILNSIYQNRTGCQWAYLPRCRHHHTILAQHIDTTREVRMASIWELITERETTGRRAPARADHQAQQLVLAETELADLATTRATLTRLTDTTALTNIAQLLGTYPITTPRTDHRMEDVATAAGQAQQRL